MITKHTSHSFMLLLLLLLFFRDSNQYGWYPIDDDTCYVSGETLYLEAWKVDKCNNNTEKLIFDNCFIKKIDDDTFHNMDTKYLSLDNNQLTSIGTWLTPLIQLTFLSINHNRIKKLDYKNFIQHKKLQLLSLSYNEISTIDLEAFSSLENLEFLNLAHNNIKTIHNEYNSLPNILQLDFSHNRIEHVQEDAFKNCTKIGEIDLGNNNLKTLPNHFYIKSVLARIYIANNHLDNVNFVKDSINMDTLDISSNKYEHIADLNLPKLNTLYIHNNHLDHNVIKEILSNHSTSLKYISFNNNNLSCIGLVELWSELQNGDVKIMNEYDYRANVKISEIGCDTFSVADSRRTTTTTTPETAYVFFYQKDRYSHNYDFE